MILIIVLTLGIFKLDMLSYLLGGWYWRLLSFGTGAVSVLMNPLFFSESDYLAQLTYKS